RASRDAAYTAGGARGCSSAGDRAVGGASARGGGPERAGGRTGASARTSTRGDVAAVRAVEGAAGASTTAAALGRGARAGVRDAPHRERRLVAGGVGSRVRGAVWSSGRRAGAPTRIA